MISVKAAAHMAAKGACLPVRPRRFHGWPRPARRYSGREKWTARWRTETTAQA